MQERFNLKIGYIGIFHESDDFHDKALAGTRLETEILIPFADQPLQIALQTELIADEGSDNAWRETGRFGRDSMQ